MGLLVLSTRISIRFRLTSLLRLKSSGMPEIRTLLLMVRSRTGSAFILVLRLR
nr:MAG TPA: hypothetical protein [Microviridae sp.]